jgi:hypothetical protein
MDMLLKFINDAGWDWKLAGTNAIIVPPDQIAADELVDSLTELLATNAAKLKGEILVRWQGAQIPYRISASMDDGEIATPEIPDMVFSKKLGLDVAELKVLERMRSSEKPMSICDLESDDQEWVNMPLTQMLQMTSDQACEQNMKNYWEEDALAYVKRMLQQQRTFDHSYEAMLPYTRAQFSSTFEVIEFGHPKRLKRLVTIHSYEPVRLRTMV